MYVLSVSFVHKNRRAQKGEGMCQAVPLSPVILNFNGRELILDFKHVITPYEQLMPSQATSD